MVVSILKTENFRYEHLSSFHSYEGAGITTQSLLPSLFGSFVPLVDVETVLIDLFSRERSLQILISKPNPNCTFRIFRKYACFVKK